MSQPPALPTPASAARSRGDFSTLFVLEALVQQGLLQPAQAQDVLARETAARARVLKAKGATATTRRPPSPRSSGSRACFCAKGRDTVRVASCMSTLSGSIFRYGQPAAFAAASVTRSSSSTPRPSGSGTWKAATISTGETS